MSSHSRFTVLESLRRALVLAPPPADALAASPSRLVAPRPGDWETLARALAGLEAGFVLARDRDEARTAVARVLEEFSVTTAVAWNHPLLDELGLAELLAGRGARFLPDPPSDGSAPCVDAASADLGITVADAALAEAGSLGHCVGPGRPRGTSLLPPVHLCLVPGSILRQGVADLAPLLEGLAAKGLPSAVHFIAGSSSTGDIEFRLVRGIHGPLAMRVVGLAWA